MNETHLPRTQNGQRITGSGMFGMLVHLVDALSMLTLPNVFESTGMYSRGDFSFRINV